MERVEQHFLTETFGERWEERTQFWGRESSLPPNPSQSLIPSPSLSQLGFRENCCPDSSK